MAKHQSTSELDSLIEQLRSSQSPKRRSAAKKLRKLGSPLAGPALFDALKHELKDLRTWETQYQLVMALGHCGYREADSFLQELARSKLEATMLLVAVGDAYVRLRRNSENDPGPLFELFEIENDESLLDGALRAVAMLRMRFEPETTERIITKVLEQKSERLLFWAAAACAGWSGPCVDHFLNLCLLSTREDVKSAANDAKLKKYRNWNPL